MKELEIDPALAEATLNKVKRSNSETGVLRGLTSLINSPEFGESVEDSSDGKFSAPTTEDVGTVPADPMPRPAPKQAPRQAPVAPPPPSPLAFPNRIFTTGRLKAGKDHFLTSLGCKIHGFADPLYALQKAFFGTVDKAAPGAREFLQAVGQWGRGTINEKYPLSGARAAFVTMMRVMGPGGLAPRDLQVNWDEFGKNEDIWLNALIVRVNGDTAQRIGVSNVRFQNEFDRLKAEGFTHFHVMCSQKTWAARLAQDKKNPQSPAANDTSEQMAINFDKAVMAQIKANPKGPKLRVIWNDRDVPAPALRFITLADIAASLAK